MTAWRTSGVTCGRAGPRSWPERESSRIVAPIFLDRAWKDSHLPYIAPNLTMAARILFISVLAPPWANLASIYGRKCRGFFRVVAPQRDARKSPIERSRVRCHRLWNSVGAPPSLVGEENRLGPANHSQHGRTGVPEGTSQPPRPPHYTLGPSRHCSAVMRAVL